MGEAMKHELAGTWKQPKIAALAANSSSADDFVGC